MKKNLMSIVILALVLANLILTVVLMLSILPQTKQANELITKVCAAIDLDLEAGTEGESIVDVPMSQMEDYTLASGEQQTINLKKGEDGVEHYALVVVTLGIDTKHADYKTFGTAAALGKRDAQLLGEVDTIISSHTIDEMRNDKQAVQSEILKKFQQLYDSDFIVSVTFTATYT